MTYYLTLREVCAYLQIAPQTAYRLIKRGELRVLNIGTSQKRPEYRITVDEMRHIVTGSRH